MVCVALFAGVLLLWPQALFTYRGLYEPAIVLPGVGALLGWWASFVAAWVAWTRLPQAAR